MGNQILLRFHQVDKKVKRKRTKKTRKFHLGENGKLAK